MIPRGLSHLSETMFLGVTAIVAAFAVRLVLPMIAVVVVADD